MSSLSTFCQSLIIKKPSNTHQTRAVIVGISDYENDEIPDLRYAHKDALAFADYLKSDFGGNIPEENVKMFLNEEATGGNVHKALYWLVKESKKDDKCIVYFSGHGDVETIYEDEPGHFLLYDSPSSIYQINSLRLDDLKRIVNTLSKKTEAKVILVTDACRSGKLAGSDINGTQATASALASQFANEVKIMSCQANEYSIEGEQWGDGRGIFSFHFIEGLIGLADADNNHSVDLKELQRYLEDKFDDELVDQRQTPVTVGDKNTRISVVNPFALEKLLASKKLSEGVLASVTSTFQEKNKNSNVSVELFYQAIDKKYLLEQYKDSLLTGDLRSAEYYYNQIETNEELASKLPIIKGDFIAALQNDAQQAINKYLQLDLEEMKMRWFGSGKDFEAYPIYLQKAAELLGEFNYLYPQVKAKQLYFEVVGKRINLDRLKAKPAAYTELEDKLVEALKYQERSSFIYNELGLIKTRQKDFESAINNFNKTNEISPSWANPYNNISYIYRLMKDNTLSIDFANKALTLKPDFPSALVNLSLGLYNKKEYLKSIETDLKYLELIPNSCKCMNDIGYKFSVLGDTISALKYLNNSKGCDQSYVMPYINIGVIHHNRKHYDEAISVLKDAILKGAINTTVYDQLGYYYEEKKELDLANEYYIKTLELNPSHACRIYLAINMLTLNDDLGALENLNFFLKNVDSKSANAYFYLACLNAKKLDQEGFKNNMLKAIDLGFKDKIKMEESIHLSSIRSTSIYNEILELIK